LRPAEPPPLPASPLTGPLTFELIDALEWRRFEGLAAAYFRTQGFRAEQTGFGGDGGIDLKLYRDSRPEPYAIVQCKAHSGQVKVEPVRAFFGVMAADQIAHGYFVSSNGFTKPALDFAHGKSLTLISGQQFLDSLNYLPAETLASIRRDVWLDDYHTPTCPRCGIKMVRRESETPFWGCSRFPTCNHTIPMRSGER
jgi:restriction system protein